MPSEPAATSSVALVAKSLTVEDIITLSQAGLSEEVIVTKLKSNWLTNRFRRVR